MSKVAKQLGMYGQCHLLLYMAVRSSLNLFSSLSSQSICTVSAWFWRPRWESHSIHPRHCRSRTQCGDSKGSTCGIHEWCIGARMRRKKNKDTSEMEEANSRTPNKGAPWARVRVDCTYKVSEYLPYLRWFFVALVVVYCCLYPNLVLELVLSPWSNYRFHQQDYSRHLHFQMTHSSCLPQLPLSFLLLLLANLNCSAPV